jgi:hypothetical protein
MKRFFLILLASSVFAQTPTPTPTPAPITLAWTAPTSTAVVSTKIYQHSGSQYTLTATVAQPANSWVGAVAGNTYAATFMYGPTESGKSNEVTVPTISPPLNLHYTLTISGP